MTSSSFLTPDSWPEWESARVVREGLPELPLGPLPPGVEVPVAVWSLEDTAAVLFISRDEDEREPRLDYSIEVLRWDDDGWRFEARGGNDWISDDLWRRPSACDLWLARGEQTMPANGGTQWCFRCGVVGNRIRRLRFCGTGSDYEYDVTSSVGAWVAGIKTASGGSLGSVEALADQGEVLAHLDLSLSSWP